MRARSIAAAVAASLIASWACPPPRVRVAEPEVPSVRRGPDRLLAAYRERDADAKAALFRRINEDREKQGVPRLAYSTLAARVGDDFCLDAVRRRTTGHWDADGRAPYLRFALAGGVDYHAQNFGAKTRLGGPLDEPLEDLLLEGHEAMMAEKPPEDGHRRTILDPLYTHVGIGVAREGSEFRFTEEFCRQAMEWVESPSRPLRAGRVALVSFAPIRGFEVGAVGIAYEPPPSPLSRLEIRHRGSYSLPPAVATLQPKLSSEMLYADGSSGDFTRDVTGRIDVSVRLDHGAGSYYVVAYAEKVPLPKGLALRPATIVRVEAVP